MMRGLRLLVWTAALVASAWLPLHAQTAGELRWGGDAEGGAPFVEADPSDPARVVGFEVDIARMVADGLGRSARFVQVGFTTLDAAVARGDFDIGLSGIEDSPARRGRLAVTLPYYEFREILTVRVADVARFRSLAELRGRRVATLGATLASDLLARAQAEYGVEPVLYEDDVHPYGDLALGRVDAVLLDEVLATRGIRRNPGLANQPTAIGVGRYVGILAPANVALRDRVDAILRSAMRDGRLEATFRRWGMWNADQPRLYARVLSPSSGTVAAAATESGNRPAALTGAEPAATPAAIAAGGPSASAADTSSRMTAWTATRLYLPALLRAAAITLVLSCLAMVLAVGTGILIASGRVYGPRPLRIALTAWVEIVRGTPLLLQLFVLYFGLAALVQIPAFLAALLGLGLNYAAYESEIYRGALEAVPPGQLEAARVLGLTNAQALRLVRGPQALRLALAPMTNDFVALLKDSSLVSVITVVELTKQTSIFAANVGSWVLPGALCAALYLVLSLPLAHAARRLEKRWQTP
jgi:polar amino acid transport system substrate-binding protein